MSLLVLERERETEIETESYDVSVGMRAGEVGRYGRVVARMRVAFVVDVSDGGRELIAGGALVGVTGGLWGLWASFLFFIFILFKGIFFLCHVSIKNRIYSCHVNI